MSLKKSNPYLRSATLRKAGLRISAASSSAVEGIHAPFAKNKNQKTPSSVREFVAQWKRRASAKFG